jgi:hypothetical protein
MSKNKADEASSKDYLSICKSKLKHHKSFYDAKKHKNFDFKEDEEIRRKIKCAEAVMEFARQKRIKAIKVASAASSNSRRHVKSHNNLDRRTKKAAQDRDRRNKAGRRACFTKARNAFRTSRTSLYAWYKKNYAECRKHDHK